jgi:alginate O-acetyltransferase complex protein AlgI
MLFNSLQFLIFFSSFFIIYYKVVSDRYRWILLLLASCYFYMVFVPKFIIVLFLLILIDYTLGLAIGGTSGGKRKLFLITSIFSNLGILFFFKYFNFFNESVAEIARFVNWNYSPILIDIALPLGLSFHIFQSLSYVIEVYKGKQKPEKNLGIYALYVMFFPQLVAGPIERPQHMLHQFHKPQLFNDLNVGRGLELMAWGFFKKLVIADKIAPLVDHVYGTLGEVSGIVVVIAALLFTYQIYCDFSGYSDIAIGSALVLGYDLTRNFDRPFASRSIAEFWRRWHISLSSWLRDYLYYPLAFAHHRRGKIWLNFSLFVTFVLIGLWHGANWTYVVFGGLNGFYMMFSLWTAEVRKKMLRSKLWQILCVFVLVSASFVFFRAENMTHALEIFSRMISVDHFSFADFGIGMRSFFVVIGGIIFLEIIQYIQAKRNSLFIFEQQGRIRRWLWYYTLIFAILFLGSLGSKTFIYFQF